MKNIPRKPPAVLARLGGRPSRLRAEQIRDQILDVAADLLLTHGYGATSIEAIAKRAGISKRTFYHRFRDKAEVFDAVVRRLVERLRPTKSARLLKGRTLEDVLQQLADAILHASLIPEALALYRVIVAEATRFPELAAVMNAQGTRQEAIELIAELLEREARAGNLTVDNARFAAEQFLQMVVSGPQRRALGLGTPMTAPELDAWARDTVTLFLKGCFRGMPMRSRGQHR